MGGQKYYTLQAASSACGSSRSTATTWTTSSWSGSSKELAASGSDWKIAFFHHPLYSSGATHGSADLQRGLIEPVFLKYGVNVAFMGHEHFYERIKPQKGVAYFIIGSSAKLRKGDLQKSALTVYGNDSDYAFMLVEIVGRRAVLSDDQRQGRRRSTPAASGAPATCRRRQHQTTQPVVPQAKPSPVQPGPAKPQVPRTRGGRQVIAACRGRQSPGSACDCATVGDERFELLRCVRAAFCHQPERVMVFAAPIPEALGERAARSYRPRFCSQSRIA